MRKIICMVLLLTMLLVASSCQFLPDQTEKGDGVDYKYNTVFYRPQAIQPMMENGLIEAYEVPTAPTTDILDALATYVAGENASEALRTLYDAAEDVRVYPVVGKYLEATSLVVCAFYSEDVLSGVRTMVVEEDDAGEILLEELAVVNSAYGARDAYADGVSEKVCFSYLSRLPVGYEVVGIRYDDVHTVWVNPLVRKDGDDRILHYFSSTGEYERLLPPFTTLSEGALAYVQYYAWEAEMKAFFPAFVEPEDPYFRHHFEEMEYNSDYLPTFLLKAPVYDSDGVLSYCVYLFYEGRDLVCEVLVKKGETFSLVYEKYNGYNEHGVCPPLEESTYVSQVTKLLHGVPSISSVKGVGFDGENYYLIMNP